MTTDQLEDEGETPAGTGLGPMPEPSCDPPEPAPGGPDALERLPSGRVPDIAPAVPVVPEPRSSPDGT